MNGGLGRRVRSGWGLPGRLLGWQKGLSVRRPNVGGAGLANCVSRALRACSVVRWLFCSVGLQRRSAARAHARRGRGTRAAAKLGVDAQRRAATVAASAQRHGQPFQTARLPRDDGHVAGQCRAAHRVLRVRARHAAAARLWLRGVPALLQVVTSRQAPFECVRVRRLARAPVSRLASLLQKFDKILSSTQLQHNNRLTITDEHVGHIHYDADPAVMFLLITAPSYPQRIAFQVLAELRTQFDKQFGDQMAKVTTGSLSKTCKPLFVQIIHKFQNPSGVDKISNVEHQVLQVKGMMHDNINAALNNTEKLETLLDISDNMKNEAFSFNRSTTQVKKRMQWKDLGMKLLIAFLVLLIVSFVVGSVVIRRRGHADQTT